MYKIYTVSYTKVIDLFDHCQIFEWRGRGMSPYSYNHYNFQAIYLHLWIVAKANATIHSVELCFNCKLLFAKCAIMSHTAIIWFIFFLVKLIISTQNIVCFFLKVIHWVIFLLLFFIFYLCHIQEKYVTSEVMVKISFSPFNCNN